MEEERIDLAVVTANLLLLDFLDYPVSGGRYICQNVGNKV
jgi:hypothetical protein